MRSSSCFYISNYPLSGNCASHQEHIDNGFYTLIGMNMKTKRCSKCGIEKPLSEFNKDKGRKDGHGHRCRVCNRARGIEYYYKNENGEASRYPRRKNYLINLRLIKKYGITITDKQQMIDDQNRKCAICGDILVDGYGTHVDHDHETGKTRGVLCGGCNTGLGFFKDSVTSLSNAIKYLQEH